MSEKLGRCSVPMGLVLSGAILYDYSRSVSWDSAMRVLSLGVVLRMMILPCFILPSRLGLRLPNR